MTGVGARLSPPRSRRCAEVRGVLGALTFLTRVPAGRRLQLDARDMTRAGPAFPLVGAGIGAAVGALAGALAHPLSPLLAAAIALAAGTLLTGALHLDGLADTADALGAHSRERALEIMREPAIGAFGTAAIAFDLLIKAAALTVLAGGDHVLRFAVAAGALSRLVPVLLAAWLPYARAGGGIGAALSRGSRGRAALAAITGLVIAAAVAGASGAVLAACAAALALVLGLGFRRWLGGVTGDALGAAVEVTETAILVAAVALAGRR
jgi:adenosylcobinamide-GDP ribazoletransferase